MGADLCQGGVISALLSYLAATGFWRRGLHAERNNLLVFISSLRVAVQALTQWNLMNDHALSLP